MTTIAAPMLPTWRIGAVDARGRFVPIGSRKATRYATGAAWCDRCRHWHHRGYEGGLRAPHCEPGTGYSGEAYALDLKGDAPPAMLADMRRARPRGPDAALRSEAPA